MSPPAIDEAELASILTRNGINLPAGEVRGLLPGAALFQLMIARVNAPLPREAEPALVFNVEQR